MGGIATLSLAALAVLGAPPLAGAAAGYWVGFNWGVAAGTITAIGTMVIVGGILAGLARATLT